MTLDQPAAPGRQGVQTMMEAAARNGVYFFETITTIFMPNFLECKKILPQIGRIRKAQIRTGLWLMLCIEQAAISSACMPDGRPSGAFSSRS